MQRISVVSDRRSLIAEAPHWDSRINRLIYVDVHGGVVSRLDPQTKEEDIFHFEKDFVSFALPFASDPDQLMISRNKQLCHLNWKTKETTVCCEVEQEIQTRFNDGKCDSKGRLWAGTMSLETSPGVYKENMGNLYSFDSSNNLKKHLSNLSISNGMAWDNAKRKLFFIDSIPRKIFVYDYDEEGGSISNEKVLIDFNVNPWYSNCGLPDGMTIDEKGKLWVACYMGGCVLQIDPNTGAIWNTIEMPAKQITSCCFGGPNYDALYVTSGCKGLSSLEKSTQPQSGAVFEIKGLETKGLPPSNFAL